MLIKLTNKLGNTILVNPDNIEICQLCEQYEPDTMTYIDKSYENQSNQNLGLKLHFKSGQTVVIEECIADLMKRIQEWQLN